jgi:recombinational DNA repair protein RecT
MQVSDRGVRDLARRDPRVRELVADVVREGDHFLYRRGLEGDVFEHEVRGPSSRPLTHAYCLIRWVAGGAQPIVMDREDVIAIRDRYSEGWKGDQTKTADKRTNPWDTREPAMWVKTVIHQSRRWLDLTPDVAAALAADIDVAPVAPAPPAELLQAAGVLPPAPVVGSHQPESSRDENGEPYDYAGLPERPADDVIDAEILPYSVQVSELLKVAIGAGRIDPKVGLGTQRKHLVALARELVGVTVDHPEELVADQAVAEELLVKLLDLAPEVSQS